jgi:hypothetical protein
VSRPADQSDAGAGTGSPVASLGTGAIIAFIAGFVVVGTPMVYFLWKTLNETLAGRFDGVRLGIAAVILLIFSALLLILSRSIRRLDEGQP